MSKLADDVQGRLTYKDYLTWPEDERWEIIDGVAYDMTPSPSRRHQEISGDLHRQFSTYLLGKSCRVYAAPFDVRLPRAGKRDEEIDCVVQPDISVICDKSKLDEQGCMGAPDLIVEILSPSTSKKDLGIKLKLYESVGVREYWVVHPNDETVLVFTLEDNRYRLPTFYKAPDEVPVGIFEDFSISLAEVFRQEG